MRASAGAIAEFIDGVTADDYRDNALLRSGVERDLPALRQHVDALLRAQDPDTAEE